MHVDMMKPRRFVFVVPRYGDGIVGGAEVHCRAVVEHLVARGHHVRVLTTTCTSYKSWRNALKEGDDQVGGVQVTRFRTQYPRLFPADEILKLLTTSMKQGTDGLARLAAYDRSSAPSKHLRETLERAFTVAQGPVSKALIRSLATIEADLFVFFGYLYYPTIFGIPSVRARAVMVPLADEEPMLYASIVRHTLRSVRALLVNVEEEAVRLRAIVHPTKVPMAVVALGIDPPETLSADLPIAGVAAPFLLVLGRAGKTRPMAAIWRAFTASKRSANGRTEIELPDGNRVDAERLTLVTAGEMSPHLAGLPRVVQLGRVEDATRWGLMRQAIALVSPSESESLSLVVLESWLVGTSVIVNAACDATTGHVRRSGGGVIIDFSDPNAGARALLDAIAMREPREERASRGRRYVEKNYRWDSVIHAYESVAAAIVEGRDITEVLGHRIDPIPEG
ncbi:MAG: glycosyltransferase family 4 protein [Polyangiales bacterium]